MAGVVAPFAATEREAEAIILELTKLCENQPPTKKQAGYLKRLAEKANDAITPGLRGKAAIDAELERLRTLIRKGPELRAEDEDEAFVEQESRGTVTPDLAPDTPEERKSRSAARARRRFG